jgi:GT2 family glycosyltransferase
MKQATPTASIGTPRDMLCIVLSFNGLADTKACLNSLQAGDTPGFDVLVVDNASKPGVVEALAADYPDIELLALPENLGWAGGNNVGIQLGLERGYRWICLLNNDTEFPQGQVSAWLEAVRRAPPCLLHPSIFYWDEPDVAQIHPELDDGRRLRYSALDVSGRSHMRFAYGACLAVHRDVFERIGTFDERFFLQLEETDFHLRAVQVGFEALCDPSVKIFHKESRAFGGTRAAIKTYYATRNTLLLIEKTHQGIGAKLHGFKSLYWSLSNLAKTTEKRPHLGPMGFLAWSLSPAPSARAVRAGIKDYLTRRFGKVADDFRDQLASDEKTYDKQLETRTS